MPIDFDAVLKSEKARDSLYCLWYNDVLREEATEVLTLGWSGDGPANSGTHQVVEWNEMYFFLGDYGHVEEGPFKSLDEVLVALPEFHEPMVFRPELDSTVLPLERLLTVARHLVASEGRRNPNKQEAVRPVRSSSRGQRSRARRKPIKRRPVYGRGKRRSCFYSIPRG